MTYQDISNLKPNVSDNSLDTWKNLLTFPLDSTRLDSYKIIKKDLKEIELLDTKENIFYKVSDTKMGNLYSRKITIKYQEHEYHYLYIYNEKNYELVRTNTYLIKDNKILEIEKELPNNMEIFMHNFQSSVIRYYIDKKPVLVKTYRDNKISKYVEECLYGKKVNYNKYVYYLKDNLIYGINEIGAFNDFFSLTGICVLDNQEIVANYTPYTLNSKYYKEKFKGYKSVIYFQAYNNLDNYSLTITKDHKDIKMEYKIVDKDKKIIEVKGIKFNSMDGPFNEIELDKISKYLDYLESVFDERFIKVCKQEIENFKEIIKNNMKKDLSKKDMPIYEREYQEKKEMLEKTLIKK